jgi:hypothetical protein
MRTTYLGSARLFAAMLLVANLELLLLGQGDSIISGTVYSREDSIAYGPVQPSTPVIGGAAVSIGTASTTTGMEGAYSIPAPTPGWLPVGASHPGFIPTHFRIKATSAEPVSRNIGLLKAAASVLPRPGFMKGALTYDTAEILHYYMPGGYFRPTYSRMREQLGANLVAYCDQSFITSYNTTANTVTMSTQQPAVHAVVMPCRCRPGDAIRQRHL